MAKENKKFLYRVAKEGARARDLKEAIFWLQDAGIIQLIHPISKPDLPLKAYSDISSFKIYLLDVGLLRALSDLSYEVILNKHAIFEEFKGSLTEQYVIQELLVQQIHPYYWSSGNLAEVDFVFSIGNNVYPLEAKSGINVHAKSLIPNSSFFT